MPYVPLALVLGLTAGDYLLWNWSLNANHEVIALVSGLTLPPLALVALWMAIVTVGRLLTRRTGRRHPVTMQGASKGATQRDSLEAEAPTRSGKLAA